MNEQIKRALWKLSIILAAAIFYSGLAILADDGEPAASAENVSEAASERANEKPVFRCPNVLFLPKLRCHEVKPDKTKEAKESGGKKADSSIKKTI